MATPPLWLWWNWSNKMTPLLLLEDVSFKYPGDRSGGVDRINLQIETGEFVGILGANGSGKSTLARLCCGLLLPQDGKVLVNGLSSDDAEHLSLIRKEVGLVFQDPDRQFVAGTVETEIAFGLENQALPSAEIRERVQEALNRCGLTGLAKTPPYFLSGGEKHRLALASLWALRPKLLIVDEPLAMLDAKSGQEALGLLKELRAAGTALLWLSHHLAEVMEADQLLILTAGEVSWEGSPAALLNEGEKAMKLGIGLPVAYELAFMLSPKSPPTVSNEEELVSWLWD